MHPIRKQLLLRICSRSDSIRLLRKLRQNSYLAPEQLRCKNAGNMILSGTAWSPMAGTSSQNHPSRVLLAVAKNQKSPTLEIKGTPVRSAIVLSLAF